MTGKKEPRTAKDKVTTSDVGAAVDAKAIRTPAKVKLPIRLFAFTLTVITLSWFFEGWREIQNEPGLVSGAYLFFGTTLTLLLLTLQGYWIYIEEKSTGKLVRKVKLFDNIEAKLLARRAQATRPHENETGPGKRNSL